MLSFYHGLLSYCLLYNSLYYVSRIFLVKFLHISETALFSVRCDFSPWARRQRGAEAVVESSPTCGIARSRLVITP